MTTKGIPSGRLGGYRLEALLGRGGMGEVFLAWDERLERHVALKRVLTDPPHDERARARFRREARAVARLSHPSIVQVFELLETDEGDVLVMEHVEGRGLPELIAEGGLDLAPALRLAAEIADGLAEAHGKGLVHRDLKPENVRVTPSGHAKILDFGLARLLWSDGLDGDSLAAAITQSGALVGTVHAMSPEQASGRGVDHRSDLFAFGSLLYQMLTGRPAFRGSNVLDTLRRVTSEEPEPLAELRSDLPPELTRLVDALLAKDPAERPQNARVVADTLEELRAAAGSGTGAVAPPAERTPFATQPPLSATIVQGGDIAVLPTGDWPVSAAEPAPPSGARRSTAVRVLPWIAAGLGLALLVTAWWIGLRPASPAAAETSIAVLYFQNLKGDPELDWMRRGIAESLTTSLAGSGEIDVLASGRLHEILDALDALDAPPSFEIIRQVAERASVGAVVRGNFTRVGDQLEINASLETAAGEILKSAQARDHQVRFFLLVDELGAAVRGHFEVVATSDAPPSVSMVTTDSLEAWRYYTEGLALFHASKIQEAELLFLKAVEVDPEFALAFADLSRIQRNLGKTAQATVSTRRAVELAEKLPPARRYNVEGSHYESRWSTYPLAIEAFQKGLELDPEKSIFREGLGLLHASLEQYGEAVEVLGVLARDGSLSTYSSYNAAFSHAALGRHASGRRVLDDLARRQADDWLAQIYLSWYALQWGDLATAAEALGEARRRRPDDVYVHYSRWRLEVLRQDWTRADAAAAAMAAKTGDAYSRWRGSTSLARNLLYRGRSEEALARLADAAAAYPTPNPSNAQARCWRAEVLLARGEDERALAEARRAREEGEGYWPELQATFVAALAEQALGRSADADALEALLKKRHSDFPNPVEQRQILHLAGRRALLRRDAASAVRALRRAEALLPPRGVEIHPYVLPDHVPVWTALGEAELLAGNPRAAREWLGKAVRSGAEHVEHPLSWVSAGFLLGRAHRELGEQADARRHFDRFLRLWQDADFAGTWVEEALKAGGD